MPNSTSRLIRKSVVRPYAGCGATYAWLRCHHDQVAELRRERWSWGELIAEMVADGVQSKQGAHPSLKNVSETWIRVCRDVEVESAEKARLAEARAEAPRRPIYPSKISPDWRPEPVVPPAPPRPAAASPGTAVTASAAGAPAPLFPVPDSGRSYATRWIPDEELDMTLAPETYEEDGGVIVPMPLDARRRIARAKMKLQAEAERDAWPGGG